MREQGVAYGEVAREQKGSETVISACSHVTLLELATITMLGCYIYITYTQNHHHQFNIILQTRVKKNRSQDNVEREKTVEKSREREVEEKKTEEKKGLNYIAYEIDTLSCKIKIK